MWEQVISPVGVPNTFEMGRACIMGLLSAVSLAQAAGHCMLVYQ